jgi:cytochrome b561
MKYWHFSVGLTILALVLVRIWARLSGPTPPIVPAPSPLVAKAAKAVHLALYALMVLMPIGGWLILSGEGKAIPFWGFELPPLAGENKDFAELVEELHEIGGKIGYALIAIHAAAALYHHHVVKDNTLRRMLPGR